MNNLSNITAMKKVFPSIAKLLEITFRNPDMRQEIPNSERRMRPSVEKGLLNIMPFLFTILALSAFEFGGIR